jgi:hypothetical protein
MTSVISATCASATDRAAVARIWSRSVISPISSRPEASALTSAGRR